MKYINSKNNYYDKKYYYNAYVNPWTHKSGLNRLYSLYTAFFCLKIPAQLSTKSKVLDVGCGVGNLVWALRKFGVKSHGVEPSTAAKQFCVEPKYCRYGDYKKLPFRNNEFDLVYTSEVLEHINEKQIDFFLKECLRVSKGLLINMICVKERGAFAYEEISHINVKSEDWWKNKFKSLKLKVKVGNSFYFFPKINEIFKGKFKSLKRGYFLLSNEK